MRQATRSTLDEIKSSLVEVKCSAKSMLQEADEVLDCNEDVRGGELTKAAELEDGECTEDAGGWRISRAFAGRRKLRKRTGDEGREQGDEWIGDK